MKRFATSFHVAFFRNAVKTAADRCIRSFQHTNPAIDFRYFQLVRGYRPNFYRSWVSAELKCLVKAAHVCEQLAQSHYVKVERDRGEA